ncbi:DUF3418 domain-containing protein, partial [bacterium]|nr:DUF3418 domain-containing protein [bacterium]
KYVFSPGNPHDGITIELPWSLLNSIKEEPFEYLVPGLLREKIHWLLKSLPKNTRIKLVPVSEIAEKTWEDLVSLKYTSDKNSDTDNNTKEFYHDLSESLFRITKVYIAPDEWDLKDLPDYLKFNFSVKNPHTKQTQFSRSFPHLLGKAEKKQDDWKNLVRPFERSGITSWDFGTLLEEVNLSNSGDIALWGYKTLSLQNDDLVLTISKTSDDAQERSIEAIAFLIEWKLAEDFSWIYRELRFPPETLIRFQQIFEKKDHLVISTLQKKFGENKTRKQEKFHKEFQDKVFNMIRRELCGYNGDPLWTEKAFTKRLGAIRFMLKGMSERVTDSINKTAELYQQVLTSIQEQKARQNSNFWERLYCELRSFISDKCFEEISLEQWLHCPRILRCYLRRVERYIEDPMAEEELITSVSPYQNVAKEQSDHEKATTIQRWNISRFRWMLEEYKVSSFAQDLKTAFPISSNRLDMFIKKNLNGL